MLCLALGRQLLGGHWPLVLLLLRNQFEETEVDGHSNTRTLDRLEKKSISRRIRAFEMIGIQVPRKRYGIQRLRAFRER